MSGSQSTIADRFPKKPTRPGSILNKDHPPDKKPKSEKASLLPAHDFDPTELPVQSVERRSESCGLVQRCVIIQKDENGFGFTVSGDNPVFVQLVKEDGAAMRAGVQTGDRIIKVNGTLVTHSNHVEVVKLIKSGSYVALTLLGRPPGLPQIPLSEGEGDGDPLSSLNSPQSPGPTVPERSSSSSTSPSDRIISPTWEESGGVFNQKVDNLQKMLIKEQQDLQAMKEEYSRNPTARLLKDIQEAQKHIPLLQGQLSKATVPGQDGLLSPRPGEGDAEEGGRFRDRDVDWSFDSPMNSNSTPVTPCTFPESPYQRDTPCNSPKSMPRVNLNSYPSHDSEDVVDLDYQSNVGSPMSRLPPPIIGAEDDDFDTDQEQVNGQCSCFQTIDLLKTRPAHLAAFLHHVVSQFDPAPLLCYLYAELYKQSNSKETRRIFGELHSTFMDRSAPLKVAVPDSISADMDRWKPDLIPEDIQRQHVQQLQDTLLPDIQKHLEDFRQKRSMGLTLAEAELIRLDTERMRGRVALERERSCSEHIVSKINEVLLTPTATEEEKCTAMQFVIQAYMKHLGVKVKESRGFENKAKFVNLLPKIKKTIKPEKDGSVEEKQKKTLFLMMRSHSKRPSRTDFSSVNKALEQTKQRIQKQPSQISVGPTDQPETPSMGRSRSSQSSEGPDGSISSISSPSFSASPLQSSDSTARDVEPGALPLSALPRLGEVGPQGEGQDSSSSGTHFDFTYALDHLQEEEPETDRNPDGGTPRPIRRMELLSTGEVQSEDDQAFEVEAEQDPSNWQTSVSTDVLALLSPHEIKRQEVINELFYTERAHLRTLKVLDNVFYQRMTRETILPPVDIKNIFTNLEEIVQLHTTVTEQMTAIRKKNDTTVVDLIGDDLLSWFSGAEEEKIKRAVGTFCSNQPFALELIKSRQKKDQRFASFVQEAESNRQCRRLQLKDMIPVEMQRLTKYPLLLENIAKYTDDPEEKSKVKRACECCRQILNHVNQEVKEAENKQRLEDYQRRLDLSSLKQSEYPMIAEFKNLNLTKRKMVHEGPLSWKVNRDKTIELYTLLLEDILVLLQRQDEKLILKCHSKNLAGTAETKHIFSPIIKLSTVLVRSVATDNKSFFVVSMSDYGAQIYELMAQTVSEQKTWHDLIGQRADCMKSLPQNDEREADDDIKMSKDPDRISTGSVQSPEKDATSCSEIMQIPPTGSNPFDTKSDDEGEAEREAEREEEGEAEREEEGEAEREAEREEEGEAEREEEGEAEQGAEREAEAEAEQEGEHKVQVQKEEEEEAFLDHELAERLLFLKQRSRHAIAVEDLPPLMADEALRTLAALRQLLINHMDGRMEDVDRDGERGKVQQHERRAGSLQGSEDRSVENGAERPETEHVTTENRHELPSADTGFFETSEDCVPSYMVLEGYGVSAESSTDDDVQICSTEPTEAGDSGIDLKKLLSSASSQNRGPDFSRQVMTHLRLLQANLQQLKDVESKYNQLCQRHSEQPATESEEIKDKS
ncbi:rho guanine nucleotide exchange factor 12 isoform 2-T2 [Clarias gariepinus]